MLRILSYLQRMFLTAYLYTQSSFQQSHRGSVERSDALQLAMSQLEQAREQLLPLQAAANELRREKEAAEDACSELCREMERAYRQGVNDREELKLRNQRLAEAESTIEKLKVLSSQLDSSMQLQGERVLRLNEALDLRYLDPTFMMLISTLTLHDPL